MEQQVKRHSQEKRELLSTVKEDAVTKSSVQQIIYDIERESQAKIGRLLEENGLTSFTSPSHTPSWLRSRRLANLQTQSFCGCCSTEVLLHRMLQGARRHKSFGCEQSLKKHKVCALTSMSCDSTVGP